jgi:hypothetical protein
LSQTAIVSALELEAISIGKIKMPYGKFIGILRCENGDIRSNINAVCVDSEDNIWAGRNIPGIISVLKPSRFKNVFNQFQLFFFYY